MSRLMEFMIKLGEDNALRTRYIKSPKTTMKDFGLADRECTIMLNGDIDALRKELNVEYVYMNIFIPSHDGDE